LTERKSYVLGVDGGGTKTTCVLLNEGKRELGRGLGGPSNHHNVGVERAKESIEQAIRGALAAANLPLDAVGAICLGMAGADRPQDEAVICDIVRQIHRFPHTLVYNDAVAALVGGIGKLEGVVIIAGTGSIAYGVNARGEERRAGGWGHLLGDEGSGYAVGLAALRAAARAYDGRGPSTSLGERLLAHLGASKVENLFSLLYLEGFGVDDIASLAPIVAEAAKEGDAVAINILREAGQELGLAATAVIGGLGMEDDDFEVVLVGGVFKSGPALLQPLTESISVVASKAEIIFPRHDPATGAALLALEAIVERSKAWKEQSPPFAPARGRERAKGT